MCDGFTSSAVLWLYIKNWYPEADLHFTIHEGKQHGLDDKVKWILTQDFNLIIVPDAGSYDKEEMEQLVGKGIDVCALDHHEKLLDSDGSIHIYNSSGAVIINNQLSEHYPNKSLSGVGVVYKFCEALDETFNRRDAHNYLDLVALGEIADVMFQGTDETRYLIMEGLSHIQNEGFIALIHSQKFSLKERAEPPYSLTPMDVAWYIGPLVNAIVRVGTTQEKETMFLAFIDPYKNLPSTKRGAKPGDTEIACEQNARVAGNARSKQTAIKQRAFELLEGRAQEQGLFDNSILVIQVEPEDNIPQEMTGLIAMDFVTKYNRPCLIGRLNTDRMLQGSMRNNENFEAVPDLKGYLEKTEMFNYVAGHNSAAGFSINIDTVPRFLKYSNEQLDISAFQNCYTVDYILDASKYQLQKLLMSLARRPDCFGNGVDEVKIVIENVPIKNPFFMGANKDSTKLTYNGIDYVRFKDLNFVADILENKEKRLNLLITLNINNYNGRQSIQGFVKDYELVDAPQDDDRFEF